jgi:hypothetical protein
MKNTLLTAMAALLMLNAANAQTATITDAATTAKAKKFADEVFANCNVFAGPQYIPEYADYISRVEIIKEPISSGEHYALLSTVMLKNKCNPNMKRDENNFNPKTFNPMKYFFNYTPKVDTKYRVDKSEYVILIHPKK